MKRAAVLAGLGSDERTLLSELYDLRLAATPQLAELCFIGDAGRGAACLQQLAREGLLEQVPERGEPAAWLLTAWGLRVVEFLRGVPPEAARRPGEAVLEALHLTERLALNDVYVALVRQLRAGALRKLAWDVPPGNGRRFFAFRLEREVLLQPDTAVRLADARGERTRLVFTDRPYWPEERWRNEFALWGELAAETAGKEPILLLCTTAERCRCLQELVLPRYNTTVLEPQEAVEHLLS